MEQNEKTREGLMAHYQTYPQLQIQDVFKYLYQSSFGCEHMVSSLEAAIACIRQESDGLLSGGEALVDRLDGAYSRVHLAYLDKGLRAETLGKLFFSSAKEQKNGRAALECKLEAAKALARENVFPFSAAEFEEAIGEWRSDGYPAVHHSDTFRAHYHPAYRVIANKYVPFLPLFAKLDIMLEHGSLVVAVEGGSASGKTSLGEILKELYDCTVLHMDDFFLRPEQRTPERYAEAGGNIDRERFLGEVLIPLSKRDPVHYRRFNCSTCEIEPPIEIIPGRLTVIEGAYSMHPELAGAYDLSVFLDIAPALQKARIGKRNSPQTAKRFFDEWIPLEKAYFSKTRAKERCDMTIKIAE